MNFKHVKHKCNQEIEIPANPFNLSINFNFYDFRKIVSRTAIPKGDLELYYDRVLKEIPQASYPTYDYSALREFLYPAYQQSEGMTR